MIRRAADVRVSRQARCPTDHTTVLLSAAHGSDITDAPLERVEVLLCPTHCMTVYKHKQCLVAADEDESCVPRSHAVLRLPAVGPGTETQHLKPTKRMHLHATHAP